MLMNKVRNAVPSHRRRLGEQIKKRRKELGLSQEQLAERANCHRNYVGSLEWGEKNATVDMLMCFAKALECTLADLSQSARILRSHESTRQ